MPVKFGYNRSVPGAVWYTRGVWSFSSFRRDIINYNEAINVVDTHLLTLISELYGLKDYDIRRIEAHEGGRNIVYTCEQAGLEPRILRVSYLNDRSREDMLGEVEFIRYVWEHGGSVPDVISSMKGNLLEEITHEGYNYWICLFAKAPGMKLADNHYRYRDGVPITEYYYNSGKTLGKLHQLSKEYTAVHRRHHFFDKFNAETISELIPSSLTLLKEKMLELLDTLRTLETNREVYGMIHLDYNDGNYMIDFATGQITVYDFDNSCFGWYMYDLADLWRSGTGWIAGEPDAGIRKAFMDDYFRIALEGYRSETEITDAMLEKLPLFIDALLMEQIMDVFECMRNAGESPECDEELSYYIRCLEDGIPYLGLFHEIYSSEEPFEAEVRSV